MSLEVRMLSAKEMAERKRESRAADEHALKSGRASKQQVQQKNSIFAAFPNARLKPNSGRRAP